MKLLKIVVVVVVLVLMILVMPFFVRHSVRTSLYSNVNNVPKKEFAIVLGAGIRKNGTPGNFLKQRLDDAVKLYKDKKVQKILISGDNGKKSYDEISVMNGYLIEKGIEQDVIFGDYAGFDTYSTMARAKNIFDIKNAVIVTQKFHLSRSVYLAQQKGINAVGFSSSATGKKRYFLREWFASIKAYADCLVNRKPKFYGSKVNTKRGTNIIIQ